LDQIINSLNETFFQINHSSNLVLSGAEQIASTSQTLAEGSAEQTGSIERLTDAVSTLHSDLTKAAEHAQNAGSLSKEAEEKLNEGNAYMSELLLAMQEINDKSTEISKIMKTIDDIAFQTNILALNAAVEAARAGSAGKGFAVVADEVRTLANRCAEASRNTAELISSSIVSTENGSKIASKTAEQLQEVMDKAKGSNSLVMNIVESVQHQSEAISSISHDSTQISHVVQTNSALAQESAASSEELSGQAHLLKQLISFFRVKNQGTL
jgi:methyl-accepting chemotaxis protein